MTVRYTPILRWKRGERVGLSHLSQGAKLRTLPLFVLNKDQYKPKAETTHTPALTAPQVFCRELDDKWGRTPFALDASALNSSTTQHPLLDIAAELRSSGLQLIPSTHLGASQVYQNAVSNCVQIDQNGVCLRIDPNEATSIANWVSQWPHPRSDTDLVIDFNQSIGLSEYSLQSLLSTFQEIDRAGPWRTVTISGTSMPQNFQGYSQGLHLIPRQEYLIWQQLVASSMPFQLDYGDYAAVSPGATPEGITWGFPINVRYTLIDDFLICRGVRTDGPLGVDMGIQLVQHSKSIASHPARTRIQCWADEVIDQIANSSAPPQGLEHWVQLGVNRHIELMNLILP